MPNRKAPWWRKLVEAAVHSEYAVARPGRFPFHDRWQELSYPFVREDSYWKDSDQPENIQVDGTAETPQDSSVADPERFLNPKPLKYYTLCSDSDENQEGCFQNGNLRVRSHVIKGKDVTVEQDDAPVEQESSAEQEASVEQDSS